MSETKNTKGIGRILVAGLVGAVIAVALMGGVGAKLGWFSTGHAVTPTADEAGATDHDHEGETAAQRYTCGMHPWIIMDEPGQCPICGMDLTPIRDEESSQEAATGERRILYWRAPMDPMEIYDAPGQSKMGMDLVPVYEDELVGGVEVKIDPVTQQNMGIRTALATRGVLSRTIRTYGHVTYDETRASDISPRFNGWVEKLHINFVGQEVKKGQPLFEIYSPELVSAQEEYLIAYRSLRAIGDGKSEALMAAARRRLEFFGIDTREIRAIEAAGAAHRTLTVRSPVHGIVTAKTVNEGAFIKQGMSVFKVADLSAVWVEAHIYEYELPWIKVGQEAVMELPYLPGRRFAGTVTYIYPYLQQKTRDVVIRLVFDNPDLVLKPEMYAEVMITTDGDREGVSVPSEAVLRSGARNLIFVTRGDGKFTPREVTLGLTLDRGRVELLTGVAAGEEVVVSGQFLLDSESKLKEAVQKMIEAKTGGAKKTPPADDFFQDMGAEKKPDDFFNDMTDDGKQER